MIIPDRVSGCKAISWRVVSSRLRGEFLINFRIDDELVRGPSSSSSFGNCKISAVFLTLSEEYNVLSGWKLEQ